MPWNDDRPPSGIPARGYSWPPFVRGNTAARTHGARSPKTYGPLAAWIAHDLLERQPTLAAYPADVMDYATAEAQYALLSWWTDHQGMLDADGEAQPWLDALAAASFRARRAASELGLDPRSHIRLMKAQRAQGIDLAARAASGRPILDAWMARQVRLGAGLDDDQTELVAQVWADRRALMHGTRPGCRPRPDGQ